MIIRIASSDLMAVLQHFMLEIPEHGLHNTENISCIVKECLKYYLLVLINEEENFQVQKNQ